MACAPCCCRAGQGRGPAASLTAAWAVVTTDMPATNFCSSYKVTGRYGSCAALGTGVRGCVREHSAADVSICAAHSTLISRPHTTINRESRADCADRQFRSLCPNGLARCPRAPDSRCLFCACRALPRRPAATMLLARPLQGTCHHCSRALRRGVRITVRAGATATTIERPQLLSAETAPSLLKDLDCVLFDCDGKQSRHHAASQQFEPVVAESLPEYSGLLQPGARTCA